MSQILRRLSKTLEGGKLTLHILKDKLNEEFANKSN